MSEPLEDEVNEELRRQQLKSIWDRFGIYVIGFAIFIILSVGGNEVLNHFNKRISERESIAFDNALTLIEKGDDSAGFNQLLKLTEGKTGYKGLAFFPLTFEVANIGKFTPYSVEQNSATSSSLEYSCIKSLDGTPKITKSSSLYLSYNFCKEAY